MAIGGKHHRYLPLLDICGKHPWFEALFWIIFWKGCKMVFKWYLDYAKQSPKLYFLWILNFLWYKKYQKNNSSNDIEQKLNYLNAEIKTFYFTQKETLFVKALYQEIQDHFGLL